MFKRRISLLSIDRIISLIVILTISLLFCWKNEVKAEEYLNPIDEALKTGNPIVVDFGRDMCIPCVKMKPILEELKEEYEGKVEIVIINIDDFPSLAKSYRIMLIPTQIFFDSDGKEVYRHVGFMSKEEIEKKLDEIEKKENDENRGGDYWKQF
ncbi:MAG: thioredoxin family protein [bacterium]